MKRKLRFTLGKKVVVMLLLMSVILCTTALLVSYRTYRDRTTAFYERIGRNVSATLASQLDPEDLDRYYGSLEMDERYYQIQNFILDLVESNEVLYLYVVRPHGTGVTFLFDSDMAPGENGDYFDGGYCSLGTYVDLEGAFADNLDLLLAGAPVEPIVEQDEGFGWQMTAMTPVLHENGTMAGYVMADISMGEVTGEQQRFLLYTGGLLALLTLVFLAVYLVLIRRSFVQPVQRLTAAAEAYEGGGNPAAFSSLDFRGDDELSTLAEAFRNMLSEIERNNWEQKELAVREQRLAGELQLANELNLSLLPKDLPCQGEDSPFQVQGYIHQGLEMACSFYDYFLLDRDRLCVLVGEVPGGGIPEALYTVMAQTAIKSQMDSGLSLKEAMTAANRQLHEMGSGLFLNVLVGVLDGAAGRFTCINAGQQDPLLMRSRDRYEWMRTLSYAPLGQSENVVYQVQEVDLHQGDRMFFHTQGLDAITGAEGVPFGRECLRRALNEAGDSGLTDLLREAADAGGAYAAQMDQIGGYALLALEYRRRDKAQAHCLVTADEAGSACLLKFFRGQLEANGIQGRRMAALMVVAEELFALCCRQAGGQGQFMAECAIPTKEELVVLRLKGAMGGRNPLESQEGEAARHAAAFITEHCDRVLLEHEADLDTVTVVKRLKAAELEKREEPV